MAFSKKITINEMELGRTDINDIRYLEKMIYEQPYKIYCAMDEKVENQTPTFFLVVYVSQESDYVLLVDQTNQLNSTIMLDGDAVRNAYYEYIDVGIIERYPIAFYIKS